MSSQMMLVGGSQSLITAQTVLVSAISSSVASASAVFKTTGAQATRENGSETFLGNWVTPSFSSDEWEIRATLDSGVTPDVGVLNTWQDFSTDRIWTLTRSAVGISECSLTFDFRRVGASDPEVTVSLNTLSAEKSDIF